MKAQTAFVWADRGIKLNAKCTVNLGFALIVLPCNAELYGTFRFNQTLDQSGSFIFRMFFNDRFQGA